jgi:hypothetical protein
MKNRGVGGGFFHVMKLGKSSKSSNLVAGLEDFTLQYLEIQVFWDVTLGQWVSGSKSFEGVLTLVGPLELCRSRRYIQSMSNHNH